MNILIAEDETLIAENLAAIIRANGHDVQEIVQNKNEFNAAIQKNRIDLAFLDIRMEGKDLGIEFAEKLETLDIPFVFITSYSDRETLQAAIDKRPFGYLVKPFKKSEISDLLQKLDLRIEGDCHTFRSAGKLTKLKVSEIIYMHSENVYVNIYTKSERVVVRAKMSELLNELDNPLLVRCHQSYSVNLSRIKSYADFELKLFEGDTIPVSRKYVPDVKELFEI